LRAALAALIVALGASAPALALPGDPPFEPLAPADGASLEVDPNGIPVTFTCPVYRIADPGFPLFGGASDYGASFARAADLGPDGRLRDPLALDTGHRSPALPDGQCAAAMATGGSDRPQETPGTYYWQVWRICTGCPGSYETGPVRTFRLRSDASVRVGATGAAYAGFALIVPVRLLAVPNGSRVLLQRRAGRRWRTLATARAVEEQAEVVVSLPRGAQTLRAVVSVGDQRIVSAARRLAVKRAHGWSTGAADDGRYAGRPGGEQSVRFAVTGGGRAVRGFRAHVAMLCPGVTPGTFTTQIGTAILRRAGIAPDGRFVGVASPGRSTALRVRGRVRNSRVSGRIELSVGSCSGSVAYNARPAG
jgi:hypothetical protein